MNEKSGPGEWDKEQQDDADFTKGTGSVGKSEGLNTDLHEIMKKHTRPPLEDMIKYDARKSSGQYGGKDQNE